MDVFGQPLLFQKARKYPDARSALRVWLDTARRAEWRSLTEIRRSFPATDMVGEIAIFNIKGNRYRLVARVVFRSLRIYVKDVLTHAEYSKERWKKWLP